MPGAVGDVQGDFGEVTGVNDAVGDELRVAGRQSRVVVAVEHEDRPALRLDDLEPDGGLKWAALREEISDKPVVDELAHHGVERFTHIDCHSEPWDEPAAVDSEPASRSPAQPPRPS